MPASLAKKFIRALGKSVWAHVADRVAELVALLVAGVRYAYINHFSLHNIRNTQPEGLALLASMLAFLILWHTFRAAYLVARDIRKESAATPSYVSKIVTQHGDPFQVRTGVQYSFPKAKLYLSASVLSAVFICVSLMLWVRVPSASTQAPVLPSERPVFVGRVHRFYCAPARHRKQDTVITELMSIDNTGSPSIAEDFHTTIEVKGRWYTGEPIPRPAETLTLFGTNGRPLTVFKGSDYLPLVARISPIPTGGEAAGFMQWLVRGLTYSEACRPSTIVNVTYQDAYGNSYLAGGMATGASEVIDPNDVER